MTENVRLWKVTLKCPKDFAEDLGALFEEESLSVSEYAPPRQPDAEVEILFDAEPDRAALEAKLAAFVQETGAPQLTPTITEVADLDWIKKVAEDFPPLPIGPWLVYGAAYRETAKDHPMGLQIDATSAFGTGEHPTTQGCLLLLDEVLKTSKPEKLLDMGCGSGILAMAFAKASGKPAVAVDMDPASIEIAQENARVNGVDSLVHFACSLGYRGDPIVGQEAPYDLIMSNIFADPLCEMAGELAAHLAPGGHAILAGLLNTQAEAVIEAHTILGLKIVKRNISGEWTILLLQKD